MAKTRVHQVPASYADECIFAIKELEKIRCSFKYPGPTDNHRRVRSEFDKAIEERIKDLKGRVFLMAEGQKIKKKINWHPGV